MKIKVNDVDLYYRIEGEGEPALVMHGGLGVDHTPFINTPFNELSNRLKLIYYDHRCNGRSSCPSIQSMTHENLAKDAEELRKYLGLEKFTLIGHSYGGMIGLEYALRYQENLSRLILITTTPSKEFLIEARKKAKERSPELMKWVDLILNAKVKEDDEFQEAMSKLTPLYFYNFDEFKKEAEKATKDAIFNGMAFYHSFANLIPNYDLRKKLKEIKIPTLILCGRHDWITPVNQSKIMYCKILNSELTVFEDSAHWPYIEEAEHFLKVINRWLDRN